MLRVKYETRMLQSEDFSVPLPRREVSGDASETAIMKYCELILGNGGTGPQMRDKSPTALQSHSIANTYSTIYTCWCSSNRWPSEIESFRITLHAHDQTFSTDQQSSSFNVSIHQNGDRYLLVMKGAPEKILKACSTLLTEGNEKDKDKKFEEDFIKAYETLGGFGERVLGFCDLDHVSRKVPLNYVFDRNPNFR
ncbi:hypothetical protein OSTOST_06208 [Ostertagia ostertagi]